MFIVSGKKCKTMKQALRIAKDVYDATGVFVGIEQVAESKQRSLSTPEQHQLAIARKTLRMADAMAGVMGGMTKQEAREVIRRLTGTDEE